MKPAFSLKHLTFPRISPLIVMLSCFQYISASAQTQLCGQGTPVPVNSNQYYVQNNEFGSGARECIIANVTDTGFRVSESAIDNPPTQVGAYPSIYKGCHWGLCTPNNGAPLPLPVNGIGTAVTSWKTEGPDSSADLYDKAYDLWFNTTPITSGQPNGAELMIWLNWHGEQPAGPGPSSTLFTTQGANFEVWLDPPNANHTWYIISFRFLTSTVPSISNLEVDNLDLLPFINEGVRQGFINPSWYFISAEAGFELWHGGTGLRTDSFSFDATPGTNSGASGGNTDLSSAKESIWWPTDGSTLSGTQPFKARLDGIALSAYRIVWSVDGGQPNSMSDSTAGGDHKEASVDLSGWTWRDAGDRWGPFSVNFIAQDLNGTTVKQKAVSIYVAKAVNNMTLSIWWPTDGSLLSGTQPFKARLDNVALSSYSMYWSVDGGQLNLMSDNNNGGGHKEVSVDLSGWTWRDAGDRWGPFSVNFIAKDLSGNLIQQKAVSIYVIKTSLSSATLSIWWPTDGSTLSGTQPFKARLDNIALSSYRMYWSVDGGQLNLMSDNTTGGDHKEASVDLTGWTWRDNGTTYGPFSVTFTAQDLSGYPVKSSTITIYRAK
jgi:cellulose 1,4-beta-cellobiosidase